MTGLEQRFPQTYELHVGEPEPMVPSRRVFESLTYLAVAAQNGNNGGGDRGNKAPQSGQTDEAREQMRRALQTSMDTRQ